MNPYRIEGPALISFSGGRTSAYMLFQILLAFDGKLPPDIYVVFANTGREREETLRFVYEVQTRWNIRIHWVEWTPAGFVEVGYNSASRNGEPFKALIGEKQFLPNAVTRFCTQELKIRTMRDFMRAAGYDHWVNAIGLRYDEGSRVLKALARNEAGKERFTTVMPMARAATKVTKRGHIMPFWFGEGVDRVPNPIPLAPDLPQGFDLGLQDYEGNCDLCFLKAKGARKRLIRDNPGMVDWWKDAEMFAAQVANKPSGARFVTEHSYADLEREVRENPFMPGLLDDDLEYDVECGLTCAPMEEAA
ncbi:Phosphoadenosine phosphosulfate reductase family protein [Bradyrhizobium brasilense]|uniref:Phosphoadenosine phosphosulfate reductase family protein n=1 Tax=Bradyrhizobium brasilense TaxID=1419277 RepID=A0A1G6YV30_9BRAD|nr:phosphoadenosine phosphosulfate reductase family protein [Bradyrhizobium brasilense]SDD94374.1 Phosphoadenosine phosphosulfate reductase family protein [Bradyrhizobium brasilense]